MTGDAPAPQAPQLAIEVVGEVRAGLSARREDRAHQRRLQHLHQLRIHDRSDVPGRSNDSSLDHQGRLALPERPLEETLLEGNVSPHRLGRGECERAGGLRLAEVVALADVAAKPDELVPGLLRLDPLRDDREAEIMAEVIVDRTMISSSSSLSMLRTNDLSILRTSTGNRFR